MFLTKNKLAARIREIESYRYRDMQPLSYFYCKEDLQGQLNPPIPSRKEEWGKIQIGDRWTGRDLYLWLHKKIAIPQAWTGKKVVGIFDFGNTGGGNNSGFESLLYINGIPFQGVDANHKEVFFLDEWIGQTIDLTFRLWSGLEGGGVRREQEHRIQRGDVAWLDEVVDDFYYTSRVVLETIDVLPEFAPERVILQKTLNSSVAMIDWAYPGSDNFYQSLYRAQSYLNKEINKLEKNPQVHVTCIGHTHIDVAWLWRLRHTREKSARSFSTVLRLMEQYPEYIFLQGQPQLYEYIKTDYPEIYKQIKKMIAEGQWEVDGGMWVEADTNLISGESLVRQILIGSRFIEEEFGKEVEYLWLPDVFGYSWALPQILEKSGIPMFMTTKISWNQYNRMPHDTFRWRGINGSEVLTHFITTPEPWSAPGSWFYTYNGQLTPKTVQGTWEAYQNKEITNELLISYGYGDGGGGVNRQMLEYRRRIDKMPGLPSLKPGKAGEFFKNLQDKVKGTEEYVHTWDGELYLEYHRGTYTSQAYNKKMNRKLELLYRETEWLTAMKGILQEDLTSIPQDKLTEGWKIILRNQFHDIIPGSSIREVYEDCVVEYEEAKEIAENIKEETLSYFIEEKENSWTIINNSNWIRTECIKIDVDKEGQWVNGEGKKLVAQKEEKQWVVEVKDVPAMGFQRIYFEPEAKNEVQEIIETQDKEPTFYIRLPKIETPFYILQLNEYGQLISIYDKKAHREVIPKGERANVLQVFEDKPLAHDAWDIDIFYQEKMREITELESMKVIHQGSVQATIRMKWKYMKSTVEQELILYGKNARIDFKTKVDWYQKHQLLKVAFPVDIRSTYATYDIQYGNVQRPTHWNTSWDWARFESVAHQWVDLSERNYGVSLLNDCKYGHDIKDNTMRLSLIKAATHPDTEQDMGEHEFTYALLPHEGDWVRGETVQEAWSLNQPLVARKGKLKEKEELSLIQMDNPNVMIDAVKRSEDGSGLILRIHEYTGGRQEVTIRTKFQIDHWQECSLMEKPIGQLQEAKDIQVQLKPYEIKTFLLIRKEI